MKFLKTLWQFSRPHTIIGSFCSITALFAIAMVTTTAGSNWLWPVYWGTMLSALTCNIYIVGLNQYQDEDIDKINKPYLPIAAGNLGKKSALIIIISCLSISLISAALLNWILFVLIATINLIGTAYSLPPLKLKRHHSWAALCITTVRGILVNIGISAHFVYEKTGTFHIPYHLLPLTIFVIGFSLGIAWFKDIPDTEGDDKFQIKTLALSLSKKAAFLWGAGVVSLSYLLILAGPFVIQMPVNKSFYLFSHLLALFFFIIAAAGLNLKNPASIKRFYMLFWGLFFVEYIIYPLSYFV